MYIKYKADKFYKISESIVKKIKKDFAWSFFIFVLMVWSIFSGIYGDISASFNRITNDYIHAFVLGIYIAAILIIIFNLLPESGGVLVANLKSKRRRAQIMNNSSGRAILISSIGYILILASARVIAPIVISNLEGYSLFSTEIFMQFIVTSGFVETGSFVFTPFLVIAPLLIAVPVMTLLFSISLNRKIVAGLGLMSYYPIAILYNLIVGNGGWLLFIFWALWVFFLGMLASKVVEKYL